MKTKVLAFFDARFQNSGPLWEALGRPNHWRWSLEPRPARGMQPVLQFPSILGAYDLAQPAMAAAVVASARSTGLGGFVLDCHRHGERYLSGAECLDAWCDERFGLAFQWNNGPQKGVATGGLDWEDHRRDLIALVEAIAPWRHVELGGRPVLVVRRPYALPEPALTVTLLRDAAQRVGLQGLYIIANAAEEAGPLARAGFDAFLDPDPAEWVSCDKALPDNGFIFLQVMAGQEDPSVMQDSVLNYTTFSSSRMVNRGRRGKVLPRVMPAFFNWPDHPDGGAVVLSSSKDTAPYHAFLRKSIAVAHELFPVGERAVFLESWNGWRYGSQIEPTTRRGDLLLRETRAAIDWGNYLASTQAPVRKPRGELLDMSTLSRIDALCARLTADVEAAK